MSTWVCSPLSPQHTAHAHRHARVTCTWACTDACAHKHTHTPSHCPGCRSDSAGAWRGGGSRCLCCMWITRPASSQRVTQVWGPCARVCCVLTCWCAGLVCMCTCMLCGVSIASVPTCVHTRDIHTCLCVCTLVGGGGPAPLQLLCFPALSLGSILSSTLRATDCRNPRSDRSLQPEGIAS